MTRWREVCLDPRNPSAWEPGLSAAIEALDAGELLVHPTSTVYGIGGAGTGKLDAEINRLKGRARDRQLIRLAGSTETLRRELGTTWDDRIESLAAEFWPGQLTLVIEDGTESGIAMRVDGHPLLLVMLGRWRSLMSSTSLNREAHPPATDYDGVGSTLEAMPEPRIPITVLSVGSLPRSASSTILSLRGETPRILRDGPVDRRRIARCLGQDVG